MLRCTRCGQRIHYDDAEALQLAHLPAPCRHKWENYEDAGDPTALDLFVHRYVTLILLALFLILLVAVIVLGHPIWTK